MSNIHVADFSSGTTAKTVTGLFQWNRGQILQIKGLDLPTAVEVHFALRRSGEATPRIGVTKDGVTEVEIPDMFFRTMMTSDYDIYAYVYVSDEEYGSTTHEIIMKVKSRPMPEDVQNNFNEIMSAVKAIADGKVDKNQGTENNGKFLGVVDGYLVLVDAPSGTSGTTDVVRCVAQELTEEQQEQVRANIGAASMTEFSALSEEIGNGTGLTEDLKSALKTYFTNMQTLLPQLAYVSENNVGVTLISNAQAIVTALDGSGSGGGEVEPDEPDTPDNPEVTLTSIGATYTGGEVAVGTSVNALTGITVKANYSDGTSKTVTGYNLSGTIAEGSNTITVSYEGLTTVFSVTGVVKEVIDTSPVIAEENKAYQSVATSTLATLSARTGMCITKPYTFSSMVEQFKALGIYDEETGTISGNEYVPKIAYYIPNTKYMENAEEKGYSTSSITRYFKIAYLEDETIVSYNNNSSYANNVEAYANTGSGSFVNTAKTNAVAFTLSMDDAEDSYAYWTNLSGSSSVVNENAILPDGVNLGDIIFAGKNTKYYGMRNISEYTGA